MIGSDATIWKMSALTWYELVILVGLVNCTHAQTEEKTDAEKPNSVTSTDPSIDVEHLKLLVKPLTQNELIIEADGWRDHLKRHVQEIAETRISLKDQRDIAEDARDKADVVEQSDSTATADEEVATERKQELAESLPRLNEEKAQLVDRLNTVLDKLESKGGDAAAYRQYVSALSGVGVEVTDSTAAWTVLQGWIRSEQGGQRWAWNIAKFLMILCAFYFGAGIVARIFCHAASRVDGASQLLVDFLGKFIKQLLTVIGLIVALGALEVNITPLLAALGAAGFVIGFALQGTLSNFASGLLILAYRPFDVGDAIEAAGVSGKVDSVSLFSTLIRTFDNKVMIVPNNDIWGGTITNSTASDTRRVDMVFGIGYEDDVEQATMILEGLVREHELVLDDPAPVVQLNELADSSVNFVVRPWCKTEDYWTVYWDITRSVKNAFDRNGISIPFPQRDIHLYDASADSNGQRQLVSDRD